MITRLGAEPGVIAGGIVLALLLLYPFLYAQQTMPPQGVSNQSQAGTAASPQPDVSGAPAGAQTNQSLHDQLPDSPGTAQARPNQPPAMTTTSSPGDGKSSEAEQDPSQKSDSTNNPEQPPAQFQQQQTLPREPLGTAAAEHLPTTGIAASRPAGVAVAPAKQRRVRSILIRVGALVGAGVAIGTTMALSQGSPSRPPGSH